MQPNQIDSDKAYDVIFLIEGTAINGAYLNDLKMNYLIPALEYFCQAHYDDREYYFSDRTAVYYGIVLYKTVSCMPNNCTVTFGPFSNPQKVVKAFDKLEMSGGGSESNANLAEGMATTLCCFEEFKTLRNAKDVNVQKHCILTCNSSPYSLPVTECYQYEGKTVEQLATIFHELKINFSIISPRKIPVLFKLFVKADGDLPLTTKNFCKDPRHLVLLKGFNLKERPTSPNANQIQPQQNNQTQNQAVSSMNANVPSPMNQQNQLTNPNLLDNQNNVMNQAMPNLQNQTLQPQNQMQANQHQIHPAMLTQQQVMQQQNSNYNPGVPPVNRWLFPNQPRGNFSQMQMVPGQVNSNGINVGSNLQPQPSQQISGNSALLTQLNQPPNQPGMNMNQQMPNQMLTPVQQQMRLMSQQTSTSMAQQMNQMQHQNVPSQHQQQNQAAPSSSGGPTGTSSVIGEREKIWSGTIEWVEKSKADQTKSTRCVQSQVIANIKDGEVEVKADNWPQRLLMQLMPKHLVGNIGGEFLKDSKVVVFKPQPSEALDSLCKIMNNGFAGCVHFNVSPQAPSCDIRILILLYTPDKKTFLGFIPNDQTMFVDQLRKVIQQKQQPSMNPQQQQLPQQQLPQQQLPQQQQQQQQQHQQHQQQNQSVQQPTQIVPPIVVVGNNIGNINPNSLQNEQNPNMSQDSGQQHFNSYNQNQIQMQNIQHQNPNNMQQINMMQQRTNMSNLMQQQGPGGVNMTGMQSNPGQMNSAQQARMVRPMMSNPGLRMLLQQPGAQPGNQFRPQLQQMVGSNPNMMGGPGPNHVPRPNTFDDSNFDFM